MVELSTLAYAVRKLCSAQGVNFPIGHAHQLLAAALGHRSLAALQASLDIEALAGADHLVVDAEGVVARAAELGLLSSSELVELVESALRDALSARIHRNTDSFVDALQSFTDDRTFNSGLVSSELAMTNGGLDEIYMPLDLWKNLHLDDGEHISTDIVGHVTVEQYPDKVYWGHQVDVEATLTVDRVGKRLFANAQLAVTRAELRWFNEPNEADESDKADEGALEKT